MTTTHVTPHVDDIPALLKGLNLEGTTADDRYQLTVSHGDGILTLTVAGFLLQPIPLEFTTRFERLLSGSQIRKVIIDLSGCTYMSSAVFSYLVKYFDLTAHAGGQMMVVRPPAKVLHVMQAIGLDTFFTFTDSLAEARSSLSSASAQP
jgi:anti-anti-sigma factor